MPSSLPRDRLILLVGLITYGMGQSLLFVIFAPLARQLGLDELQLGLIIAASNMMLAFSAPRWGRASQRLGRRTVFLIGLAGFAAGYALLAFGIQLGLLGIITGTALFGLLLVLRLLYGVFVGGIGPAATAYIADTTDEQSRSAGMALVAMAGGLGTIVGPAFGIALALISPVFPMFAAAALAAAAGFWAWAALPEPPQRAKVSEDVRLRIADPRILPYLLSWVVVFGVFTGVQTITAGYIEDRFGITDTLAVQRTMMIALLSMAFVTIFVQAVVLQRWKAAPATMLKTGFAIMTIGLLLLAYGPGLLSLYTGYALFGLSFGFTAPGLNAAGSLSVRAEEQGAVAGLLAAAPTVGMIFGPIICGWVYSVTPVLPMLGGAALTALLGAWFVYVRVPDPRERAAAAESRGSS
ncbi:MAG: MFS transporter [Gammaproteobacteria bacterium]|nr:MFS transporter [Gammaproteobacteria bacterium]MDH5275077.1 MFS transporter [Gammaproteobacteria bacterium]